MSESTKRCPFCGEEILAIAFKCRYCGSMLNESAEGALRGTATGSRPGSQIPAWAAGTARIPEGTEIREYRILGLLGEGGMGEVYKAEHTYTGQLVAIKAVHPGLMADQNIRRRFLEEGRVMADLKHPNIVSLLAFFEDGGRFFLVLEYIDGITLDDLMRKGALGPDHAVRICSQVLAALHYAHTRPDPVIHRDIKPANIMLEDDGRVVVADFGIARAVGREKLTKAGSAIGTFEYMSPEQIRGDSLDHRADLYSVGITLYQMLVGQVPFPQESDSGIECMNAHLSAPVPDLAIMGAPSSVRQVVDKALSKDPAERFQSGGEFRDALISFVGCSDEPAHPASMAPPPVASATETPADFVPDTPQTHSNGKVVWILLACLAVLGAVVVIWWISQTWGGEEQEATTLPDASEVGQETQSSENTKKIANQEAKPEAQVQPDCVPVCDARTCGDDGCRGSCGKCAPGSQCQDGRCRCVPKCGGRTCGSDGCGGPCGTCLAGEICREDGQCGPDPAPTMQKLEALERESESMDRRVKDIEETCRTRRHCYGFAGAVGVVAKCSKAFSEHVRNARIDADSGRIPEVEQALQEAEKSRDYCEQFLHDLEQETMAATERGFGSHIHQRSDRTCPVFQSDRYTDWSRSRLDKAAVAAHRSDDHQLSFELWRELVVRKPDKARYWNELGDQAGFLKEFGRGLACNQKALELGRGKHWFFWGNIATDYYRLGMAREGIDAYQRYLRMVEDKKGRDWMVRHESSVKKAEYRIREMREHLDD